MSGMIALVLIAAAAGAYYAGRSKGAALRGAAAGRRVHSLPVYHGAFVALATVLPLLAVVTVWPQVSARLVDHAALSQLPARLQPADELERASRLREIANIAGNRAVADQAAPELRAAAETASMLRTKSAFAEFAVALLAGLAGFVWSRSRIAPAFKAQTQVETFVRWTLMACSVVAVLTTIGIVASVLFESLRFFARYPVLDFLFGTQWSPQVAIRADQVGQSGAFGMLPLFAGTLLITFIAMCVAAPIGLFSAIYLAEYASASFRAWAKPLLEILAGVPTVVFGFFAAITVAPLVRSVGTSLGLDVASESALAAGLVMGVMIVPFVSSLSDDVINAVPQSLRDGAYALGSTKSEVIKQVVLTAALPGIVSALMLAISRAVGETMIVVMAAGLAGNLTFNPLEAVTTITVQIKTLLVGDQEFDSVKTLSAFALGLVLFFFTLTLNWVALKVVSKYREQYD